MKKRVVILLGAGAALGWKANTTGQITQAITEDKKFLTKKGEPLAAFIQHHLAEYYHLPNLNNINNDINFEFIINTLESLADYLYQELQSGGPPQFMGSKPAWFALTDAVDEMMNYWSQPLDADPSKSYYRNTTEQGNSPVQLHAANGNMHHLLEAIKHYLYIIRVHIMRYDTTCNEKAFDDINSGFFNFYTHLKKLGYTVRFYSTNYDDIIPKIIGMRQKEEAPFNGYEWPEPKPRNWELLPNIKRVLTDFDSDVHYNLHGNIFWDINNHPDRAEMIYTFKVGMPQTMNFYTHQEFTNPAESTNIYNIVTGFNKLQKITMEPLRSFMNTLSIDCIHADLIISVGYSYGDYHINKSLKNAVDENNATFVHIGFTKNFFGEQPYFNMQRTTLKKKSSMNFKSEGNEWLIDNERKAFIYKAGYEEFLKSAAWTKFAP